MALDNFTTFNSFAHFVFISNLLLFHFCPIKPGNMINLYLMTATSRLVMCQSVAHSYFPAYFQRHRESLSYFHCMLFSFSIKRWKNARLFAPSWLGRVLAYFIYSESMFVWMISSVLFKCAERVSINCCRWSDEIQSSILHFHSSSRSSHALRSPLYTRTHFIFHYRWIIQFPSSCLLFILRIFNILSLQFDRIK